ncbi:hypothetical protein OEZ85_008704 [Tetradesmus obliquus]|uniref:Diphthine--ammonia ligase n=1 Tax=Tetradesmus obliquus TaxID=3088 RepID=A0ABY8TJZ0_TETOB|nr:hypothetical protein OEZ85_008704 [Tetradesmus obliquus]
MKVVALVSGGKDSCFSMHLCGVHGHQVVALANLLPPDSNTDELDSYMYQTVGHQLVAAYAACTGLPLYRRRIHGASTAQGLSYSCTAGDEVEDLTAMLAFVKERHPDVQGVASGAIASDYQRLRVESVCSRLGLVSLGYLWHQPQDQLLSDMIANNIEAVLVKVAAIGLDPHKHLGKSIRQMQPLLRSLRDRFGCNVCGEGGEYETLTLDCPAFRHGRILLDGWELPQRGLSWLRSCFLHLYLADMAHFGVANEAYCRHLPQVDPPSRACVQVPLPAGCPVLLDVLFARQPDQQQQQQQPLDRRVLHVQSISSWAPSCIGPYSQATSCNGLIYMAGQIPLDPASMTTAAPSPAGLQHTIAAQAWRTLCSCQAVAVAVRSCFSTASLGLTVYLSEACAAAGGQAVVQAALQAAWADRSVLDCLEVPAAVLQAAAAAGGAAADVAGQDAGRAAEVADHSTSGGSCSAEEQQQGGYGEAEREESEDDEGSGFVDDYLKPPAVEKPLRPTVVYVTVPALPRGALLEVQPVLEDLAAAPPPAASSSSDGDRGPTQLQKGLFSHRRRSRTVPVRAEVDYGEQHPVLTAPLRDAHRTLKTHSWPQKSSLFLFRTDGMSCSRELVTGTGTFRFSHPSTQQHLLVWRDRPKVVMVIKKLGRELLPEFLEVVEYLMEAEQMHVVVEPSMYEEAAAAGLCMDRLFTFTPEESGRLASHIDFVVCLGGDGVILHASSLFKQHIPPVVSFHLGSMGFLTNHPFPDFRQELRQVIYGCQKLATCSLDSADMGPNGNSLGVMITLRMRLHCAIVRAGQSEPDQVYEVLNEIVLDRGSNSFLTNIEAYIQGRFITRVQADGIMLATPTGSTAYSVAAGGSMVHPNVQAILLTPICPHSLNFRPIILPDYVEMELRVPDSARVGAWVCFDGKQRQELQRGDSVFIKMSENPVPTINRADLTTDWFESLERCFRWSNRMEQKPFQDDWVMQEAQAASTELGGACGALCQC